MVLHSSVSFINKKNGIKCKVDGPILYPNKMVKKYKRCVHFSFTAISPKYFFFYFLVFVTLKNDVLFSFQVSFSFSFIIFLCSCRPYFYFLKCIIL